MRGHPQDYDDWEAAGCTVGGWADMGRCIKDMEDREFGKAQWRGAGGAATAFLDPVLGRANLDIRTGVEVERINFNGKRAAGASLRTCSG